MSERFTFSEPFRSQLIRALNGHAPWKLVYDAPYSPIPPTAKQISFLKRLGAIRIPQTKADASEMIDELLNQK